jgi:hypothetical protein
MSDSAFASIKSSPAHQELLRHPSLAETDADHREAFSHSRKRSVDQISGGAGDNQGTRKGRACLACRKLKVKCDSLERGDAGCSRCQRLGLECVTSKRLRISLDDDG